MSWFTNIEAKDAPLDESQRPGGSTPADPNDGKIDDPSIPGRRVKKTAANAPFLNHKAYRDAQKKLHDEWAERQKAREEAIARGELVGPPERDPTAEEEVGLLGLLKFIVYLVIVIMLAGKFFTGSFTWESESKWLKLRTYMPTQERLFTEALLAKYDGTDEWKPIYLAIDGDVYDVSSNRRTYGPGGSYHLMAGCDAARSFATGCFKDHRTHDLRGLTEKNMKSIQHWKDFFANHKTYRKVGKVLHAPIDPATPSPVHCDPKKRSPEEAARVAAAAAGDSGSGSNGAPPPIPQEALSPNPTPSAAAANAEGGKSASSAAPPRETPAPVQHQEL